MVGASRDDATGSLGRFSVGRLISGHVSVCASYRDVWVFDHSLEEGDVLGQRILAQKGVCGVFCDDIVALVLHAVHAQVIFQLGQQVAQFRELQFFSSQLICD